MTNIQLREFVMADRNKVLSLLPTPGEYTTIQYIRDYGRCTTLDLVRRLNISTQSASARLRKACNKGYLQRKEVPDPTGGYYYEYYYNLRGVN